MSASEKFSQAVGRLLHGDEESKDRLARAIDAMSSVDEADIRVDDLSSYAKVTRIEDAALLIRDGTHEQRLRSTIDELTDDEVNEAIWAIYYLSKD